MPARVRASVQLLHEHITPGRVADVVTNTFLIRASGLTISLIRILALDATLNFVYTTHLPLSSLPVTTA